MSGKCRSPDLFVPFGFEVGGARGEGGVVDAGVQGGGGVEEPGSWGANSLVSDDLGGTLAAAGRSGDRARSS